MAEFSDAQSEAPNMADLLEYFEARSRSLDDEGHPILDASTLQFISLIRFNGIPILPPVLTENKREEMQTYKHAAVKVENRTRAKRREDMHTKVQSIVAGVEERRAANQAAKSGRKTSPSGPSRKSGTKDSSETITRLSSSKSFSEPGKRQSAEIVINVPASNPADKHKSSKPSSSSAPTKSKSSPSNYKSLGKLGGLNKQKSLSSQHLDRTSASLTQSNSEVNNNVTSKTNSSKGLLPHPPVGRPPSRGSSLRQSASTPDLRNIDEGIKTEDLRKPLPSSRRSLSPKGGRPTSQSPEKENLPVMEKKNESETVKTFKSKSDKSHHVSSSRESTPTKKESRSKLDVSKTKVSDNKKIVKESKTPGLHNPLETLEKELVRQEEAEKSQTNKFSKTDVRADLDPIQTAAAELFPYPISEEEALATLDSLQTDFASLEQMDSLPNDYNGIPLTSVKEQQIIHMLTKLSRALNIEDTLASTTGSTASNVQHIRDLRYDQGASGNDNKSVNSGASRVGVGSGDSHDPVDNYDDGSINITNDSSVTGPSSGSAVNTSVSSRGRMSPTSSSILSSASSVGASRSRMSPKSLKNTVHFSSFVTEISTSASQSYEDKISIRKLDITPKNSENFEESENTESKNESSSRSCLGPGTSEQTGSLLNRVALSPSVDSSSGSPGQHQGQGFSFNQSGNSQDGDLNTSDKENEFNPSVESSSSESYQNSRSSSRNQHVLNVYTAHIPEGPIGENHPAVVKSGVKSDHSDTGILKGSEEKLTEENLSKYSKLLETNYCYNSGNRDLDIYAHGTNSSTSSMQEDITRAYILQHQRGERYATDSKVYKKKQETSSSSSEGVSVVLQPVLPHNFQNPLNVNRSMLEEEDQIRSNLQRVLLVESEDDSSDDELDTIKPTLNNVVEAETDSNESEMELHEDLTKLGIIKHADLFHLPNENPEKEADEDKEIDTANTEPEKDVRVDLSDTSDEHKYTNAVINDKNEAHKYTYTEHEKDVRVVLSDISNEHKYTNAVISDKNEEHNYTPGVTVQEIPHEVTVQEIHHEVTVQEIQQDMEEVEEEEEEGKAEHIQKYLNHVHEQSMQIEEEPDEAEPDEVKTSSNFDIGSLIQSFTSTLQSMNHLSQEDLFRIQAEQFEQLQKKLIEQQRAQLENLFVTQRREQMALEKEIESYQGQIQDDIETMPMIDPQQAPVTGSVPEPGQAWHYTNQPVPIQQSVHNPTLSPPFRIQPVPAACYPPPLNTSMVSHNTSYSTIPFSDIHAGLPFQQMQQGQGHVFQGHSRPDRNNISQMSYGDAVQNVPPFHNTASALNMAAQNLQQSQQHHGVPRRVTKKKSTNPPAVQTSNPYIYPTSPSLSQNPGDRDNESDVSGFARATPKQLVFSNHSTPVPAPKISTHRPVMHSPAKRPTNAWIAGKPVIPEKVFDPNMKPKFDRVSAAVKGYLTRRLLKTHKVEEIIKTINDTRNFAFSFQAEAPIRQGTFTREDRDLLERIVAQLQAALFDIHEIFFLVPVSERMALISSSRLTERDQYLRESKRRSTSSVSTSQPKLSKATLKALERKKRAQLAEEAVFGSTEFRPKSAPPNTSSPHTSTTDISGPLRRHYHSLFVRALRPLQGQISPIRPDSQISVREIIDRPKSAGDKVKIKTAGNNKDTMKTKKVSGSKANKSSTVTVQSIKQQKTAAGSKSKKMEKAWR